MTVSYTHLDVYKRQMCMCVCVTNDNSVRMVNSTLARRQKGRFKNRGCSKQANNSIDNLSGNGIAQFNGKSNSY